jgi:acyl carrier protein
MNTYSYETELRAFLTAKFRQDLSAVPLDGSLSDKLALDSLDGLELMAEIEDRFDLYFTDEQISQPRTLRNILEAFNAPAWRHAS